MQPNPSDVAARIGTVCAWPAAVKVTCISAAFGLKPWPFRETGSFTFTGGGNTNYTFFEKSKSNLLIGISFIF